MANEYQTIMPGLIIAVSGLILLFGFVIAFGAPYLPTMKNQRELALDLLALKPGETLLELGCGDGRVIRAAAQRGLRCVGYELNPFLVIVAWLTTIRYRSKVKIIWGNYWNKDWPPADGIFVFLLDKYMDKLDKKIIQWNRNSVKLVSFAFKIRERKPSKHIGGLFLYKYNANLREK